MRPEKFLIIFLLLSLMCSACASQYFNLGADQEIQWIRTSDNDSNLETCYFFHQVKKWQKREQFRDLDIAALEEEILGFYDQDLPQDMGYITAVRNWVEKKIVYVEDSVLYGKAEYWASANKTLKVRQGDCDDQGILVFRLLYAWGDKFRDSGLKTRLGIIVVKKNWDFFNYHVLAAVYIKDSDDFWLVDIGPYSQALVRASEFFNKRKDVHPVCFFNFTEFFTYQKVVVPADHSDQ